MSCEKWVKLRSPYIRSLLLRFYPLLSLLGIYSYLYDYYMGT